MAATDVMQGIVYGTRTDEMVHDSLFTRFDFDEAFGTVINRFCTEAVVGQPLTLYGNGNQKRGFIDLIDSVQCLTIAAENPPDKGEYRVFNQLDEVYSLHELANEVTKVANEIGLIVETDLIPNPRLEKEDHFYKVEHNKLKQLGFHPTRKIRESIRQILTDLLQHRGTLMQYQHVIPPKTTWASSTISISEEVTLT